MAFKQEVNKEYLVKKARVLQWGENGSVYRLVFLSFGPRGKKTKISIPTF